MALRKASSYSKKNARPYTRKSAKKAKAFVKAVPPIKIVKFSMGNQKDFNAGKHPFHVLLISEEKVQVRDNALEAGRMMVNKILEEQAPGQFFLMVKVYPHHILRDNKAASGAGADRLSSGMKQSFGTTIGRAAIVDAGKEIFFISAANEKTARIAREALANVRPKVPCRTRILFQKVKEVAVSQ